jgi:hypothetical protein
MMKEIGFAFDAFGQWSGHDRSKMKWRMKVRIEWRPSKADRKNIGGRPTTFSLLSSFPPFPSTISLVSSTTTPLGQNGGVLAT